MQPVMLFGRNGEPWTTLQLAEKQQLIHVAIFVAGLRFRTRPAEAVLRAMLTDIGAELVAMEG